MVKAIFLFLFMLSCLVPSAGAQTLSTGQFRIEWQVVNRFRLFRDPQFFKLHENAWRQYLLHADGRGLNQEERDRFVAQTSVIGSEHVLNDRFISFSGILRENFDRRGWAARGKGRLCYESAKRTYTACGSIDSYLNPKSHEIEFWLSATTGAVLPRTAVCQWRIDGALVAEAPCDERVSGPGIALPYPGTAEIAVNVIGEQPIILDAAVRDLLIAGLGDSFASGEGNPDLPVEFGNIQRHRNLYPQRLRNDGFGSAEWTDQLCHRSLYGQHLRAALQIAVENPQIAVTFLDYSCSGASIENGILGPQTYVERIAGGNAAGTMTRPLAGGSRDSQLYRLMRDLCRGKLRNKDGIPICNVGDIRRRLDFLFLSAGGNDIGFSSIVAWATLRDGISSAIASFFGATVSDREFSRRVRDLLPGAFIELAAALETAVPLSSAEDGVFDPSRVILAAYPDLVTDQNGGICQAAPREDDDAEADRYPANQSLDLFSSWLTARPDRLEAVRGQFSSLFKRMGDLAGDHGWNFAGRIYADKMFEGHGFCAQDLRRINDPAEILMIPCHGKAERDTLTCQPNLTAKEGSWRPYDPATQNYPYASRQRWVRTFNDAYMTINQKVADKYGKIDEEASAAVFSETTGAIHPTAEGQAAMADGLMLAIRPIIYDMLYSDR
jgi:hypothetical protein